MAATKELVKASTNLEVIPFDQDIGGELTKDTGIENLDKSDYKTPRITLLQGLSPEMTSFPEAAKAGHFWHSGMNVSLGSEFMFVPCIAAKRVIIFRPRNDQGGGMLAYSRNAKDWDMGGGKSFEVNIGKKKNKKIVIWNTGKDVLSSGLTEWGSADPEDDTSPPAANECYEYLVYLPQHPELSPCVMGLMKTALPNGKNFNTSLLTIAKSGKPISKTVVKCFAEEETNEEGTWTVPNFKMLGWAQPAVAEIAKSYAAEFGNYKVEYKSEDTEPTTAIDDEIKY